MTDSERLEPIPAGSTLLHIGPHKTGTTAVQGALQQAVDAVRGHGVDYLTAGPWARPAKAGWAFGLDGMPRGVSQPPPWHWRKLVKEVAASDAPRRCISNEDFGRARPEQLAELVGALGGDGVHVLAVVRRLDTMLPSLWQERVKHGETRTLDAWLRPVLDLDAADEDFERRNVWFAHDIEGLLGRWLEQVPAHHVTVVALDEARRDQLPHVVEDLLALPRDLLQPPVDKSNRGLTWAECELVRRVNLALGADWPDADHRRYLYTGTIRSLQRQETPPGPKRPPFPAWALPVLKEQSDRRVSALQQLPDGVRLVGDPELMRLPDDLPTAEEDPAPPGLDYDLSARALAAAVRAWRERETRDARREAEQSGPGEGDAGA